MPDLFVILGKRYLLNNTKKIPLFLWNGRNRVEQNTANKPGEKLRFRAVLAVFNPKSTTKNAKSGDKIVTPNKPGKLL